MLQLVRIIIAFALSLALGDVKIVDQRDSSGTLRLHREVKDTGHGDPVKHGWEITYYSTGDEQSRFHYQNDILDGPWKELFQGAP